MNEILSDMKTWFSDMKENPEIKISNARAIIATRNRVIHDYYEHIASSKREEAYYEIVVQYGDCENAPCGHVFCSDLQRKKYGRYAPRNSGALSEGRQAVGTS